MAEVLRNAGAPGIHLGVLGENSGDLVLDGQEAWVEGQHIWVQGLAPGWDELPPENERAAHPAAFVFDPLGTAHAEA